MLFEDFDSVVKVAGKNFFKQRVPEYIVNISILPLSFANIRKRLSVGLSITFQNMRTIYTVYFTPSHEMAYKSITGGIFEAGFSDSILPMWAAFLYELHYGKPISKFAGCVTPKEASLSHNLFTAALKSNNKRKVAIL